MEKSFLINAIIGQGFTSFDLSGLEKAGLVRYTGNQWNEDWEWNRSELEKLDTETLEKIYNGEAFKYVKPKPYSEHDAPACSLPEWWTEQIDKAFYLALTRSL
jgi:hypothetical protein